MTKTRLLLIPLIVLLVITPSINAVMTEQEAGMLPGNTFYFLDVFFDDLKIFFTSSENKPKVIIEVANERLAEKVELLNQNKPELAKNAETERLTLVWRLRNMETHKEIAKEELQKHITILEKVKEKLPLDAQKGITTAITESKKVVRSIDNPVTQIQEILPTESNGGWASGDLNADNRIDANDVKYIIDYYRGRALPPDPVWRADVDGDCITPTLADVVYLSGYVNGDGLAPIKGNC